MPQMSEPSFPGARLKVKRAGEHLQEFQLRFNEFIRKNGHSIGVKREADTGCDALEFIPCKALPPDFMCIVGDVAHNLRCALDFAMSDMEFALTGKRTKDVEFPACKTGDYLERAVTRRLEGKAPKRVIDYIVHSMQPCEGGNGDAIYQLHRLDIEDKHRLIIPHLQLDYVRNIRYIDETDETFTVPEWAVTDARTSYIPTGKRNVKVTYKGDAAMQIFFGHGSRVKSTACGAALRNSPPERWQNTSRLRRSWGTSWACARTAKG